MSGELLNNLVKAVIMIVTILIAGVLIPYIKGKIGLDKWAELRRYAEYAVRCAEQIYQSYPAGTDTNVIKKDYVYDYIEEKAEALGIVLEQHDIELMIEGIVNSLKD